MSLKTHFILMAGYNARLNTQVYNATDRLTINELGQDRGAFFGSISGTLNHIVVADLLWLARFRHHSGAYQALEWIGDYPVPARLDQILYPDFDALSSARQDLDRIIMQWISQEVEDDDLERDLVYSNTRGITSQRDFGGLLAHFFNHQTHHRGQVSTLLSQAGQDVGITDFLVDIPDKQAHD